MSGEVFSRCLRTTLRTTRLSPKPFLAVTVLLWRYSSLPVIEHNMQLSLLHETVRNFSASESVDAVCTFARLQFWSVFTRAVKLQRQWTHQCVKELIAIEKINVIKNFNAWKFLRKPAMPTVNKKFWNRTFCDAKQTIKLLSGCSTSVCSSYFSVESMRRLKLLCSDCDVIQIIGRLSR